MSFLKNEKVVIEEFTDQLIGELSKETARFVGEMCDAYDLDFNNDAPNIAHDVRQKIIAKLQQFED